jgi:hypothetical protein
VLGVPILKKLIPFHGSPHQTFQVSRNSKNSLAKGYASSKLLHLQFILVLHIPLYPIIGGGEGGVDGSRVGEDLKIFLGLGGFVPLACSQ